MARPETVYFCTACNLQAPPLAVGHIVTPFWQRLPQFFVYPLRRGPLAVVVLLAVLGLVFPGSVLLRILRWAVLVKYSYAVLSHTAQGRLEPPRLSVELITRDFFQVFKQYALFFILSGGAFVIFGSLGRTAWLVYTIVTVAFLPAMIMILVANDDLIAALNPLHWFNLVGRIGVRYFQMYLFLLLLMGAPAVIAGGAGYVLPGMATYFVMLLAKNYYTIVAYNLMGYILLQYHEELGYEVSYEDFQKQKSLAGEEEPRGTHDDLMDEVGVLAAEERFAEAVDLIASRTGGEIEDLRLSSRYYNLLKKSGRFAEMAAHGARHLDLLVREGDHKAACAVYKECLGHDPGFSPAPRTLYRIAGWLVENGDFRHGINAYARFIKADADNAQVPVAYYNIARVLADELGDNGKAAGVLKTLLSKYPSHEICIDARRCLDEISA